MENHDDHKDVADDDDGFLVSSFKSGASTPLPPPTVFEFTLVRVLDVVVLLASFVWGPAEEITPIASGVNKDGQNVREPGVPADFVIMPLLFVPLL